MESFLTIDKCGNKFWKNKKGQLHREDRPAVEDVNGDKFWFLNGVRHRTNGPAIERNGSKFWFLNGQYHRENGPAVEESNGDKYWYLNGKFIRSNKESTKINWLKEGF